MELASNSLFEPPGESGLCQPDKGLSLRSLSPPSEHVVILELKVDENAAGVDISDPMRDALVETSLATATGTDSFFTVVGGRQCGQRDCPDRHLTKTGLEIPKSCKAR
jgi:hypothetical protein